MTQIIPDIINIVIEAIFAILGLFFTGVAVPWLIKTGIPWLKDKRLYGIVTDIFKAAEKQREAGALPIRGPVCTGCLQRSCVLYGCWRLHTMVFVRYYSRACQG